VVFDRRVGTAIPNRDARFLLRVEGGQTVFLTRFESGTTEYDWIHGSRRQSALSELADRLHSRSKYAELLQCEWIVFSIVLGLGARHVECHRIEWRRLCQQNGSVPTDRFNLALEKGNFPGTRRHRFLTTATYDLPFGKLAGNNYFGKLIAQGWQISGILLWQTGLYLTPTTGNVTDPSGTALNTRATNRPEYTSTSHGNLARDVRSVDRWFDSVAFTVPGRVNGVTLPNNGAIGRFGYVGPGSLVGPNTSVLSMKMQKRFNFTERVYATLEGSAANLGNTPNFGNPQLNITNAQFGHITATQGQENAGSRSVQVGIRVGF